ncbi:MAG TPA: hypothetical protein VIC85_10130 [Ktedonobacterales bacterium]|jgi:hypothetical protein
MADDSLILVQLDPPLPCGVCAGERLAHEGLAEPDPARPGLWSLLPICPVCAAWRAPAEHRAARSPRPSRDEYPPDSDTGHTAEPQRPPPELAHR